MTTASLPKRLLASVTDLTIFCVLFSVSYFFIFVRLQHFIGQNGSGFSVGLAINNTIYLTVFISWFLFITLTEFKGGQSVGKRIVGIKVVRQDLSHTTFFNTSVRHLFDLIDLIMFAGIFVPLTNKRRQRIGDFVAGTMVVDK